MGRFYVKGETMQNATTAATAPQTAQQTAQPDAATWQRISRLYDYILSFPRLDELSADREQEPQAATAA